MTKTTQTFLPGPQNLQYLKSCLVEVIVFVCLFIYVCQSPQLLLHGLEQSLRLLSVRNW